MFQTMQIHMLRGARRALLAMVSLGVGAWQAQAVTFTLASAGPPTWTYNITFAPFDNYSIPAGSSTTITLTGLTGVTGATPPTSTDFPVGLDAVNLAWTPQVLNGGTTVVWTHVGGGTGNFSVVKHIFGFSITAAGTPNRTVSFFTNGFAVDSGGPSLDISGTIAGPSNGASPIPIPGSWILTLTGMGAAGAYQAKNRLKQLLRRI